MCSSTALRALFLTVLIVQVVEMCAPISYNNPGSSSAQQDTVVVFTGDANFTENEVTAINEVTEFNDVRGGVTGVKNGKQVTYTLKNTDCATIFTAANKVKKESATTKVTGGTVTCNGKVDDIV